MAGDPISSDMTKLFLEKGLIGAVALLAVTALIWTMLNLLKSKDERIKDQKLFSEALQKTNAGVTALTVEVNKSVVAAASDGNQNSASLRQSLETVEKSVDTLRTTVGGLRDEHVRLTTAVESIRKRY